VALAHSFGIAAERMERTKIAGSIERALAQDGPYLIDLVVSV
jgi:thiamine pyrophosphate-dependent acetolactate synthase large subunit-like protein